MMATMAGANNCDSYYDFPVVARVRASFKPYCVLCELENKSFSLQKDLFTFANVDAFAPCDHRCRIVCLLIVARAVARESGLALPTWWLYLDGNQDW